MAEVKKRDDAKDRQKILQKSMDQIVNEKTGEASNAIRERMDKIREKKDLYVPLVLAEVGDFKISDFIVDYSTPRGTGVHA